MFVRDRQSGRTELISIGTGGGLSLGFCFATAISANGRFVAFESNAPDLVAGDTNDAFDVFVRDLARRTTQRVSVADSGAQSDGFSFGGALSANGGAIVFSSIASNLVPNDTNGVQDVFVRRP